MRAVLDVNVIVSAVLSPDGTPARLFRGWLDGAYQLVVSPALLEELERVLGYHKIASRLTPRERNDLVALLRRAADLVEDPQTSPVVASPDPNDDYLIVLAAKVRAVIVSGDRDLLTLADRIPVYTPTAFLGLLEQPR